MNGGLISPPIAPWSTAAASASGVPGRRTASVPGMSTPADALVDELVEQPHALYVLDASSLRGGPETAKPGRGLAAAATAQWRAESPAIDAQVCRERRHAGTKNAACRSGHWPCADPRFARRDAGITAIGRRCAMSMLTGTPGHRRRSRARLRGMSAIVQHQLDLASGPCAKLVEGASQRTVARGNCSLTGRGWNAVVKSAIRMRKIFFSPALHADHRPDPLALRLVVQASGLNAPTLVSGRPAADRRRTRARHLRAAPAASGARPSPRRCT